MADIALATPPAAHVADTRLRRTARRLVRRPANVVAMVIIGTFFFVAILAPVIAPYPFDQADFLMIRKPPSWDHLLGTDEIGRDILSRIIWGSRASMLACIIPILVALTISIPVGLLSGYAGGWLDAVLMRITDAMLAVPFLIIAISLTAFLGPDLWNAMLAIGVASMPVLLRLTRSSAMTIRAEEYVDAARVIGARPSRIAVVHILPNMLPPLLVQSSVMAAHAVIAEASLSFLGLGQQPPDPSWGSMLNAAQRHMVQAPWMAVAPGAMIFILVISLNVMGDGLRDALDSKQR